MKAPRSCRQCRGSKRKCTRPGPGEPCDSCKRRRLQCGSDLRRRLPGHGLDGPNDKKDSVVPLEGDEENPPLLPGLSWDMAVEFVDYYLGKVHGRPHCIFHPGTVRAQLRNRSIRAGLLYALCAIGSKFSPLPDRRVLEARLTAEAKRLVQADLENACIENVQACVLLALLTAGNCQTSSAALFARVATGMSEIIHLDSQPESSSFIVRETSLRIWWSLYVIDRWCFSGFGLPRHMDYVDICSPLPMDDSIFDSLEHDQLTFKAPRQSGIFGHMIILVHQFGPIQDINRTIAQGSMDAAELGQRVERIGRRLESWRETLPADIQMTVQNLHSQQQDGQGGAFVALHLAYHHFSTLLYFHFLEQQQSTSSASGEYASRCKSHASSFSSLLHLSRQMKGCEPNYPNVGHMTTVSSSVLVHTLLFGDLQELQKARRDLNMNFEGLLELQKYWPLIESMVG
ncbi:hypothetical protein AK830_g4670 [Neonectria ditissima]|uniref:Zn(2)-C6 fungal-type domain-containing protein n=1 Tax=Neonectria ditissima TaxID=78410 RepID=A0A0P7BKU9_9HYPO|nr:hypothetical protein AK830_g4670 [Neonectria ditissima]